MRAILCCFDQICDPTSQLDYLFISRATFQPLRLCRSWWHLLDCNQLTGTGRCCYEVSCSRIVL